MREWKKPEVKVFDVKMDENIAVSGEQILFIIHNQGGVSASKWKRYSYYVSGNTIVDTNHTCHRTSTTNNNYYTTASVDAVYTCRA